MFDLEIAVDLDRPTGHCQSEAQIILLGLHEQTGVQPADRPQRFGAQPHAAADEDTGQRAALLASVGQMGREPGGAQGSMPLERFDHPPHRARAGIGIVIQKNDVCTAGSLAAEGLRTTARVAVEADQDVRVDGGCIRRAVDRGVVHDNDLVVRPVQAAIGDVRKRLEDHAGAVVRSEDEADDRALALGHGDTVY